ncbi:MAG: alpha/beta hydrolase [Rubrivivax sp.]|nr:MAG: alpha/beta hydrolase [Rubrivivax sp.]
MDSLRYPGPGRSDTLVVMLPGAYSRPTEFVEAGFPQALLEHAVNADALIVDSPLDYYSDRSMLRRLREAVVQPARAEGYRRIWLVGISLGGMGALGYAVRHGPEIDGVLALAPYLGPRRLTQQVDDAGGPHAWRAAGLGANDPEDSDELGRELWRTFASPASVLPPVHLGYGLGDRFAGAHHRFAELLPRDRVSTTPGGHDWPAWRALWQAWLSQGLLADSRCANMAPGHAVS